MTDIAGRCRIVAREGKFANALANYRKNPDEWFEVGEMNSRGKIVHLSQDLQDAGLLEEMRDSEPLMAGIIFFVDSPAERQRQ